MTKPDSAFRIPHSAFFWIAFAVLTVFVYLFGLTIPLLGPDEPRYAQVAREMFERGDWVTPTLGGFNWFEKPGLLYWLQIGSYHLFGVGEFAARFGSALFGLGTVACLWILGKVVSGADRPKSAILSGDSFANWLAMIGASTIGLIVFSRGASFDIVLTFPITASLVGFFVYEQRRKQGRPADAPLIFFYFFIGVSLLAKGLVGAVFPLAIVALYFVFSWRWPARYFLFSLIWGALVSLLVAATWYLPMCLTHRHQFIDEFFIQHHFQRYTSNKYLHPQPFHFFFWVLPLMTIPWLPFFLAAIWSDLKGLINRRDAEAPNQEFGSDKSFVCRFVDLKRFAYAWLLVPLVFFSFSGSKLPGYILPIVPAAVVIAGVFIWNFIQKSDLRAWAIRATAVATLVTVVVLLIFVVPRFAELDSVKSLIAAADDRGFRDAKVINLHTISHNAEFYAAGRLVREPNGKQKRFQGPLEVRDFLRQNGGRPVLVLVPHEWLKDVIANPHLEGELLRDSGELAIAVVSEPPA